MQTFLYVWGPFLLQLGGGLGLTGIGAGIGTFFGRKAKATVQLKRAERDRVEDLRSWSHDADCFIDDLVVKAAQLPSLEDALPAELRDRMYELNANSPRKQLERAKPRRRATSERER